MNRIFGLTCFQFTQEQLLLSSIPACVIRNTRRSCHRMEGNEDDMYNKTDFTEHPFRLF